MSSSSTKRTCSVLLVDDDSISLALLQEHLRSQGYTVLTATTVSEAIECLKKSSIEIVIADWVMPGQSGLDLCRWLRTQQFDHPIHFVMLTVHSDRERLVEAFDAGVDDFLSKPIDDGELLARLRAWTRFVHLQQDLSDRNRETQRLNDELAIANASLAELALQDELTLLPNRREAMRRLDDHWATATRYGHPLSCVMIDVDRFKSFNDRYGHAAGDSVLQHIASTLRQALRASDGVFRIGGDEFLVLFPCTASDEAAIFAKRFQRAVASKPITLQGEELLCSISFGLAEMSTKTATGHDLIRHADSALYAAKNADRRIARTG